MNITVIAVPGFGAEDVVVDPGSGAVFTGTADGSIFRVVDGVAERVTNTGGRPLGLEIGPDARLLVCDAHLGLLWVDPASGDIETIVAEIDGVPMRFCNNAAIGSDGTIWFTDSSRRFSIERWRHDFIQDTRTGRLLRRRPDGTVESVIDGLGFANGVALAADESFVAVAETAAGSRSAARLWRP